MIDYHCTLRRSTDGQPLLSGRDDLSVCLSGLRQACGSSPIVPDKASLLGHRISSLRYRLCATVSPAEKRFESELRGWRDHRPHTQRANHRPPSLCCERQGPRTAAWLSLQACYSPANENMAVARRPSPCTYAIRVYLQLPSATSNASTTTGTGRYGQGRASLGLERHPGESERKQRNCGTPVPNHAA